ncbi:unnamed protein product [Brassica rapa]|uniref:Uncharacterized protein n=1 Tax=Brassica campestris TaxID=3711 RepID=A0A8D9MF56_BRACM|nr:unnamed protein product [Brassica rapa]
MTDQRNRYERSENHFRRSTSHNLHKESQSPTCLLTQEESHQQHEEGSEPAMPSFGKYS